MTEEITLLPVREFPDHGTKWLLESPENTNCLLRIVDIDLAECIEASRLQHIPTTFIPDNLRKQEADVIFLAPFLDQSQGTEREVMIYVLIEHQSAPRWEMGFRMLFYMTQIWDRQRRGWLDEKVPETQWRFCPILPVLFLHRQSKLETAAYDNGVDGFTESFGAVRSATQHVVSEPENH